MKPVQDVWQYSTIHNSACMVIEDALPTAESQVQANLGQDESIVAHARL